MTALLLLLLFAQPPVIAGQSFAWDYSPAEIASGSVTRFEMRVDAGAWASLGLPTPTGDTYTALVPALTPGAHTVEVRACNVSTCSDAALLAFTLIVKPEMPHKLRIDGDGK